MATPTARTTLDNALLAHSKGLTPVPLRPGMKAPADAAWPEQTYDSTDQVIDRFTQVADRLRCDPEGLNLGVALGARHGHLVNIDVDNHKAMLLASDFLPPTFMRSGRPGRPGAHYWYVSPEYDPGVKQYRLPDKSMIIEFRGSGGQTVLPPSIHPDGETYLWWGEEWGGEDGATVLDAEEHSRNLHAAVMLIALLVTLADAWPAQGSRHSAYLALIGGLLRDADEHGIARPHPWWLRQAPGIIRGLAKITRDADGAETRVKEALRTTADKISRDEPVQGWPTLADLIGQDHVTKALSLVREIEEVLSLTRARPITGVDDPGTGPGSSSSAVVPSSDISEGENSWQSAEERDQAVAMLPDADRDPLRERLNEWEPVNLGPYLSGGFVPPEPGLLFTQERVDDKTGEVTPARGLIYPGRVNSLYGPGGSGKTLIALHTALQVMSAGENVMLIDFEDEPHNTMDRFEALGADLGLVRRRFAYLRPESAPLASMQIDRWGNHVQTAQGRANEEALSAALAAWQPSLIIVDGTTTLYRIHGQDTNSGGGTDIIGGWLRRLTDHGKRTVILIDHTAKSSSPGSMPVGSQHKIAMIQGTSLHVYSPQKPRRGLSVDASLYIGKDRPGRVSEFAQDSSDSTLLAATVTFDSTGDLLQITLQSPGAGGIEIETDRRSVIESDMQTILDCLQTSPGDWLSVNEIKAATGLRLKDGAFRARVRRLLSRNLIEKSGSTQDTRYRVVE